MYIISIMQLAEKQEGWILITTATHLLLRHSSCINIAKKDSDEIH